MIGLIYGMIDSLLSGPRLAKKLRHFLEKKKLRHFLEFFLSFYALFLEEEYSYAMGEKHLCYFVASSGYILYHA